MAKISISEGLNWLKTLEARHAELVGLRNQNSFAETRYIGANAEKNVVRNPTYEVKALDQMITKVNREITRLNNAIKKTNAKAMVIDYDQDESVLGELS